MYDKLEEGRRLRATVTLGAQTSITTKRKSSKQHKLRGRKIETFLGNGREKKN